MRYTNKRNFPDFVVEWLESDDYDYDENTISATTLMQPPKMYALKKQNAEDIEIDVEDLIASRYGTAIHDSVEKVNLTGCKQEERLKKAVKNKIISGKFDILRELPDKKWELIDVKSTSVWTYIYGSRDDDYKKQLSIYRYLANQNGYDVVQTAKIWMIFTDWSNTKAKQDPDYPQSRIAVKEVDLWADDFTLKYIGDRIALLDEAVDQEQKDMTDCTDEELWASKDTWAIVKKGGSRALKVHATEADAMKHLKGGPEKPLSPDYEIVHRKGKVARCKYCSARKFCGQYARMVKEGRSEYHD